MSAVPRNPATAARPGRPATKPATEVAVAEDAPRYAVPALERGLKLLQMFDRQHTLIGAPDMARELALPRSTVFRITQTLERLGFLEREGNLYRLGPAVLRLGFEYVAALPVTDLARPTLERLRDDTGYTAQLAIRDGHEVVLVLRILAPSAFASNIAVGTRMPAHATVLGRMFLSDLSEPELRALFPDPRLPAYSAHTPRSLAELTKVLAGDRERGYAISESFFETSISAVAAPVRDHSRRVVAALSITISQPAIEPKALKERLVQQVCAAAAEISHRMNYREREDASVPA
jgi:DNA-binding IclR family transcriptional regulator